MRSLRIGLGLLLALAMVSSAAAPAVAQSSDEDYRPDLLVAGTEKQLPNQARFVKPEEFTGDDVYEAADEEDLQQVVLLEVSNGKHIFVFRVENDGVEPDTYVLRYSDGTGGPGYNARLFLAEEERNNRVKRGRAVNNPATSDEGYEFDLYPAGSEEGPSYQLFWLELKVRGGFPDVGRLEEFVFEVESLGGQDAASRVGSVVDRMLTAKDHVVDVVVILLGEEVEEPGDDDDGDDGGRGLDEIDPSQIRITDPTAANVFAWPITRNLTVTAFAPGVQTWPASAVRGWIGVEFFNPGNFIAGNMWFVRRVGNQWQAAPLEWIFQGMTRQFMTEQIIREHALLSSGWGGWFPRPGEEIGFFLSTPGWGGARSPSGLQRTQIVLVRWGCRGNC